MGRDTTSWFPFRFAVRWDEMLLVADRDAFRLDPVATVANLTWQHEPWSKKAAHRGRILRAIARHLPDVMFGIDGSRLAENILRSAALCVCS